MDEIDDAVSRIIPYEDSARFVKEFIFKRIDEFSAHKNIAGYIGAIGLFLAASSLFSSIRTIMNRVFLMEKAERYFIGKLRDLGMVLIVMLFFMALTAALPALGILRDMAAKMEILRFIRFEGFQSILITSLSIVIIFCLFFMLYLLIPRARLGVKVIALSALWATVFWELAKWGFGYYVMHLASLKQIYGAYVLLIVAAFWIYYSAIVFILAAEIGQLYRERRAGVMADDIK